MKHLFGGLLVVIIFCLFGVALLGAAAVVLAIPVFFPLTTIVVLVVVGSGMASAYIRKTKRSRDQERQRLDWTAARSDARSGPQKVKVA